VVGPDDDEVVGFELILAPAGRRDEQSRLVEADRQVALPGADEAARPEPSPGSQDRLSGCGGGVVHRGIVRAAEPPRTIHP
jgi:hypothetical protein